MGQSEIRNCIQEINYESNDRESSNDTIKKSQRVFSSLVKPHNVMDLKGPSIAVLRCQNLILPIGKIKEKSEGNDAKFAFVGISTPLGCVIVRSYCIGNIVCLMEK